MSEYYTSHIDPETNIAVISARGVVTPEGFYDAQDRLLENVDWRGDTDLLIVLEDDTSLEALSFNTLSKFGALFQSWTVRHRLGPKPLTAIVCRKTIFKLARNFWNSMNRDAWIVEVALMHSEAEAVGWIRNRREAQLASA
ncbi:MAG: hypothetical protein GYB36_03900 [Alphaproteobacteria bacterium]|nr:hypothetical protein [Alphaproteobacteria bacterium]